MTKEDYKKKYLKQNEKLPTILLFLIIILFIIFIFERVVGINFAPQLYAATIGPMMLISGIFGINQNYSAYKAEFVQYRRTRHSPILTATGEKAKRIAILYCIFAAICFILPGILFSCAILYLILK